jgi:5-methylcytosine-specific restriction protein A
MAGRPFRTEESISAEIATRNRVEALLERHGFNIRGRNIIKRGTATTQVIEAQLGDGPLIKMHVRLCWRRTGRHSREHLYSAAQLRARLDAGGWEETLENIAARHAREGLTHLLLVQDSPQGFVLAALVPSADIPAIWLRQRDVSDDLLSRGLAGNMTKNHAANGSSPTLWLQDDRHLSTHAVADVLWGWPGVINVMALPLTGGGNVDFDSLADITTPDIEAGRDGTDRIVQIRSGYPRDPKVRALVRDRAAGTCEREDCGERRTYPGFLDVHHILGIEVSDRFWTCVALCPNCHREAHFSPDRDKINERLAVFARRFVAP